MIAGFIIFPHVAALTFLIWSSLSLWLTLILYIIILVSLICSLSYRFFLVGSRAIRRLVWHSAGGFTLLSGSGKTVSAVLLDDMFVHELLIILNLKSASGLRYSILLMPGMTNRELLRRIRIRLLYAGHAEM